MGNKNIDGLVRIKTKAANRRHQPAAVDSVVRKPRPVLASKIVSRGIFNWQKFVAKFFGSRQLALAAAVIIVISAFGGGAWFALTTTNSRADANTQGQVLGDFTDEPSQPIPMGTVTLPAASSVSNDVLFNTPIEYLNNYLASVAEPDIIAHRKDLLAAYLTGKKSPLAKSAETIAAQPHWQLILAIAFAESSLGKNCMDNNCSNIGSKPSAPAWRQYSSYDAWVVDFNRLLDRRYKDWTLEQMCGVYVKPCNPNWLLATQQILGELKDNGIE